MNAPTRFEAHRDRFLRKFPVAVPVEKALKSPHNPSPFFYFSESSDPDLKGCWWVLGRLGPELEKQFDIAGELLFLFTPYEDLQRRTFNAMTDRLRTEVAEQQIDAHGQVRFTPSPSVSMLWTPDPLVQSHLEAWNLETGGEVVAAVPDLTQFERDHKTAIATSLGTVMASRDLYRGRHPVTGNDFFGRGELLRQLQSEVGASRSIGIFGLRRSGKTSVIREFQHRNRTARTAVILTDLESSSSLDEIPSQLASDLLNALRNIKETDNSVWLGAESEHLVSTFGELSNRLVRIAEKNRHIRFVIALDEMESLIPLVQRDPDGVRIFLAALRRAAQQTSNVSLLLTGVTTMFFEESMLADNIPNPLFGFVDEIFLKPFTCEESTKLVKKLGRSMALDWEDAALEMLHEKTGGFPFFVRDLASATRRAVHAECNGNLGGALTPVTLDDLQRAYLGWTESAARLWSEIVVTLTANHAMMGELAQCRSDAQINEWMGVGTDATAAAQCLEQLGLLIREGDHWGRSSALVALQQLGSPQKTTAEAVRHVQRQREDDSSRLRELISAGETDRLEFKETARFNIATKQSDPKLLNSVLRTIGGFLNANGGTLLIGVSDTGVICGIDRDLKLSPNGRDGYELFLRGKLKMAFDALIVDQYIEIHFPEPDGLLVCEITVSRSTEPAWCVIDGDEQYLVRLGNETQQLKPREAIRHIEKRRL